MRQPSICICLFIGAMGKSAQVPLHVWLPDSMEGPTPISALIHAATMVTAGIFMVARMSPLFELSETALSFVLVIGATTALVHRPDRHRAERHQACRRVFHAVAAWLHDGRARRFRVSAGIFHLMTHAFFKALLFLGAGSVIIAMHHEQDMRYMGGLRKYMPITWITMWIGSLALAAFLFLPVSSRRTQSSRRSAIRIAWGAGYAYFCVLAGVLRHSACTAFRLLYLTFHGKERFVVAEHGHAGHGDPAQANADAITPSTALARRAPWRT